MHNFQVIRITHDNTASRLLTRVDNRVVPRHAPLWQLDQSSGEAADRSITWPAVFVAGRDVVLRVRVRIDDGNRSDVYRLGGFFEGHKVLFSGRAHAARDGDQEIDIDVAMQVTALGFIPLKGASIVWRLYRQGIPAAPQTAESPPLEIYWLPRDVVGILPRGIPVELMRLLAGALNQPSGGAESKKADRIESNTAVEAESGTIDGYFRWDPAGRPHAELVGDIVRAVFHRIPPRYDVWQGSHHYTDIAHSITAGNSDNYDFNDVTLLLARYLHDPVLPCNCYDQAAILQVALRCVGVYDVAYCYMDRFGYLRPTGLIGRGQTNNPFYRASETPPIVPERDPIRSAFANHAFCGVESPTRSAHTIADSTTGPHLGAQPTALYVADATDETFPDDPRVRRGTIDDIISYTGVTAVDGVVSGTVSREAPAVREFTACVDYDSAMANAGDGFIAQAWPSPLDADVFDRNRWQLGYQELLPGAREVHKTWSLRSDNQRVVVSLYVAHDSVDTARQRFLNLGSTHSSPSPIFARGPSGLGHCAAVYSHPLMTRYLWIHHNIVFDIVAIEADIDVEELARWYHSWAASGVTDDLEGHRPPIGTVAISQARPRAGDSTEIHINCPAHCAIDIAGGHSGLRLAARDERVLRFSALHPATDTVTLLVIDPRTLIARGHAIAITVTA
ncbi:MAG: hypothetical protein MJE77_03225 [Proteobacteria bacterium]|nr:hypothetical protein [Pseudomonadota bacterium]